jgi:hypothetical protein
VLCARQSFARLLDEYCSRIVRFVADVPEDLSPPPFVYEGIQCASQILQVYEASLGQDSRRVATGDSSATDDSNVDGDKGNEAAEDDEDLDAADAAAATALPVDANGDRMCVEFFFFFFFFFFLLVLIFLTFFFSFSCQPSDPARGRAPALPVAAAVAAPRIGVAVGLRRRGAPDQLNVGGAQHAGRPQGRRCRGRRIPRQTHPGGAAALGGARR